jgi:GNAT superfamily N-acetyltransferase
VPDVVSLSRYHDRSGFDCGVPELKFFLKATARQHSDKGKGYGGLLLAEAIHRTVLIAEQAGLIGLFADAKDERAHKFYERYGFGSLPGQALQIFLPLETLRLAGVK